MDRQTLYTQTSDGFNIAYTTAGGGVPFVHMPWPINHIQLFWRTAAWRPWLTALAERYRLVQYDGRGSGMSQRNIARFSLDACVRDLEAVADRLQLSRFVLFGGWWSGQAALAYAARHPERVSALVLWATPSHGGHLPPWVEAMRHERWQEFLQGIGESVDPQRREDVSQYIEVLRQSSTPSDLWAISDAAAAFDVRPLLGSVQAPAIVLHPERASNLDVASSNRLAAALPNAKFVWLEDAPATPQGKGLEPALAAIDELVRAHATGRPVLVREAPVSGAFRTLLFTDLEGHTTMMQRLGDIAGREVLREHERVTRELLQRHGGAEVKTMGDGFMAAFSSVTNSVECAVATQRAFAERNATGAEPIVVRVGINAGEPIAEDDDLFGTAVILAARIAAKAQGGEILVSDVVRALVAGKGFAFVDRGETPLKGIEEPVRLYEVRWNGS